MANRVWERIFLDLHTLNKIKFSEERQEDISKIFRSLPTIDDDVFKKLNPIEQAVAKLLAQYAIDIHEDQKDFETLLQLIENSKKVIESISYKDPLIEKITKALLEKYKELEGKVYLQNSNKRAKEHALFIAEQERALANEEKSIQKAARMKLGEEYISKYGSEDGIRKFIAVVEQYNKHAELYNEQMTTLMKIDKELYARCSPCIHLINRLFITKPIVPWAKYLPSAGGGARSKKSKTRRRR